MAHTRQWGISNRAEFVWRTAEGAVFKSHNRFLFLFVHISKPPWSFLLAILQPHPNLIGNRLLSIYIIIYYNTKSIISAHIYIYMYIQSNNINQYKYKFIKILIAELWKKQKSRRGRGEADEELARKTAGCEVSLLRGSGRWGTLTQEQHLGSGWGAGGNMWFNCVVWECFWNPQESFI